MSPAIDSGIRIVVVDDHQMVREGVCLLLAAHSGMKVAGSFSTAGELVSARVAGPVDVILVAMRMDCSAGQEIKRIREAYPRSVVLVLPDSEEDAPLLEIIRAGAKGYVMKKAPVGHLFDAIRTVARGGTYVSPTMSRWFLERIQFGGETAPRRKILARLSPRELEVMRLVADGLSSKEVAHALDLEVETIRGYRKNLMRKLGVNKVASLTRLAISLRTEAGELLVSRQAAGAAS